jgi:hypothetical protein
MERGFNSIRQRRQKADTSWQPSGKDMTPEQIKDMQAIMGTRKAGNADAKDTGRHLTPDPGIGFNFVREEYRRKKYGG